MTDQETKNRIQEKALDHFLHFGFSKVTMNELSDDLGMSKKTLYQHFPSKEELLGAVVNKLHEGTASQIESIVTDQSIDFVQKLQGALNILAAFQAKMTPHFMTDLEKHAPEVCRFSNDFRRDRIRTVMSQLVSEGIEKGYFRSDIDPELIVLVYAGALQHLLRRENFDRFALSVSQIHRVISKVVIEGIVTEEARTRMFTETRKVSAA